MNFKKITFILFVLFTTKTNIAQTSTFFSDGMIEFERKLNLYAVMDEANFTNGDDSWKKSTPQFKISYFNLKFNSKEALYEPGRKNPQNNNLWPRPAEDNSVHTDFIFKREIAKKNVYGETFIISDSNTQIKWKITDEIKIIAGYECRRANALIMDSIYVVAFYTDQITTSGGPESFKGLPGMILGVAIPHQHISWFATKVDISSKPTIEFKLLQKSKQHSKIQFYMEIKNLMKDWGKSANKYFSEIMF